MAIFTVVIMEAPYGKERAYTALRFALSAALEGHKVKLFLVQDGVFVAKKGQAPDAFRILVVSLKKRSRKGLRSKRALLAARLDQYHLLR